MTQNIMHNTPENELKKFIEDVIKNAYAAYQERSTARVEVEPKREVQIWINSENPYLENNFWKLLNDVTPPIEERLNKEGYTQKKSSAFYDFIVWHYAYTGESAD